MTMVMKAVNNDINESNISNIIINMWPMKVLLMIL